MRNPIPRRWLAAKFGRAGALVLLAIAGCVFVRHILLDPEMVLLLPSGDARWMRADTVLGLNVYHEIPATVEFRFAMQGPLSWGGRKLVVTAFRRAVVRLDGEMLLDTGPDLNRWKTRYTVVLPGNISAQTHELRMSVTSSHGPPMLRVEGLPSGVTCDASIDGTNFRPAVDAGLVWQTDVMNQFDSAWTSFKKCRALLAGLMAVGTFLAYRLPAQTDPRWGRFGRWVLMVFWLMLAFDVRTSVPAYIGYDTAAHLQNIRTIAEQHRLPTPLEQWQSFQTPLYYMVSGAFYAAVKVTGADPKTLEFSLRWIPLLCGLSMVQLGYAAVRQVFPSRGDLQLIGAVITGFLPVNLYMAQTISNEPMAAAMAGIVVLLMFWMMMRPERITRRLIALVGVFLGLAWLTKVTAIIWLLPVELSIAVSLRRQGCSRGQITVLLFIVPVTAIVVGSWYLAWNWWTVGKPLFTGSPLHWWAYPGYRTPMSFLRFGGVLVRPVLSGTQSLWDSIYGTLWGDGFMSGMASFQGRPPYNYWLMACGLWLAIVPTALMFLGFARTMLPSQTPRLSETQTLSLKIAGLSVALFLAAIAYVFLKVPICGSAKASYMLGTAPCIALLTAAGFDVLSSRRMLRAIFGGALFTWAVTAYLTYFV